MDDPMPICRRSAWGQSLQKCDVRATSALPPIAAEKRTFLLGWAPHQLRNRQNEPSFTLALVESGSVPKAIEFVLNPPADLPPA
jgi:hypothetical protein